MRTHQLWLQRIARLGLVLMLGASMSACAGLFGLGGTNWKEEALQPDGQKIVVDREVSRKGRHEIGQSQPIGNQSLAFTMPVTGERVKWEDTYSEELGSASFNPMLLAVLKGKAYVLSVPAGCLSYNKWGRPNPPYVVFKYEGKEWNRISMQELPTEIVNPNLIISSPDDEVEQSGKRFITAEMIGRMNLGFKQPAYKTILRAPTPGDGGPATGCGELIYDGRGGWQGPGLFSRQPSKEACFKYCKQREITDQYCPCNRFFK